MTQKIMSYRLMKDLLKENSEIRSLLEEKFQELGLTNQAIANEGRKAGHKLNKSVICNYRLHGNVKGTISHESLLWLCEKYGIDIKISAERKRTNNEHE